MYTTSLPYQYPHTSSLSVPVQSNLKPFCTSAIVPQAFLYQYLHIPSLPVPVLITPQTFLCHKPTYCKPSHTRTHMPQTFLYQYMHTTTMLSSTLRSYWSCSQSVAVIGLPYWLCTKFPPGWVGNCCGCISTGSQSACKGNWIWHWWQYCWVEQRDVWGTNMSGWVRVSHCRSCGWINAIGRPLSS